MKYITDESELKNAEGITGIYFYAQWLPFHKKMKIMIEKVEAEHEDIVFYAIDTDSFTGLCKRFNVRSIPTTVITTDGGAEIKRINGVALTSGFKKTFNDIYKSYQSSKLKESKNEQQE